MEWLVKKRPEQPVRAVLFDFDGTLSTLRCNWEEVMEGLMTELLAGSSGDVTEMVRDYIDQSTGIQTIHQMKWLAEKLRERTGVSRDPWDLKEEYNRRLMITVGGRRESIQTGAAAREDFLVAGGEACLAMLWDAGVRLYVASGTDDPDVRAEAALLGLSRYFHRIQGAPVREESCSKEAVIRMILKSEGVEGERLAVVGDGKVEIGIGRDHGARTLGIASDERARSGVNPEKRRRLTAAGADAITGDFLDTAALERFFFGATPQHTGGPR